MKKDDPDPDRVCVERCLRGDLDAFGTLIDRYERPVFHAILHMVGNREDAREICQQVFMKAFEHLASYDPERKFFSWIYRAAMNESINHLKARHPAEPLSDNLENPEEDPETHFESIEAATHLQDAVMSLPQNYRAVIIMRHFLHLSYREVADVLDVPEKVVKSRLFTARQLLREALEARGHVRK
jgi:RNA polymerase sigma-70 factor (ECF subfamily)